MKLDYSELYYKCRRPELAQHICPGSNRVLDVGCAEGFLGESLKQMGRAQEVVGIELFPEAARVAESRLSRVICGDIETIDRNTLELEVGSFDYIICGDVLEHLRNPWAVLSWLASLLKRGGRLIVSIPNVRHWSVTFSLLFRGEWTYHTHGILDRTHLRFFTRKSAIRLFMECGLQVETCEGNKLHRKKDKLFNLALLGMGKELVTTQWIIVGCRRKGLGSNDHDEL